jgi:hypothetical protein
MRVFQESADYMLSKHNKAFLGALQQMMVAVFGPGMEQAFSCLWPSLAADYMFGLLCVWR